MRKIKMKDLEERILTKEDLFKKIDTVDLNKIAEELYNTYIYASVGAIAEVDIRTGEIVVESDEYTTNVDGYYITLCNLDCTMELPDLEIEEDEHRGLTEEEEKEQEQMRIDYIREQFDFDNIDEFYKED